MSDECGLAGNEVHDVAHLSMVAAMVLAEVITARYDGGNLTFEEITRGTVG